MRLSTSAPCLWLVPFLAIVLVSAAAAGGNDDGTPIVLPVTFDVSPDGTEVAFSWRGELWSVPITGGTARRLTTHPADDSMPRFSPDGRELAFVSNRFPGGQVFRMPAQGGTPRQVTWHTDGCRLEGWFRGGGAVLISASRDDHWRHARRFYRIDMNQRAAPQRLFNAHGRDGSISPDGKTMLFVREGERWWRKGYRGERAAQIWMHELGTNAYRKLSDDRIPHEWPLWHPEDHRIYYVSEKDGTRNLWTRNFVTEQCDQLTHWKDDGVTFPVISRNGRVIVFRRLFDLYALQLDQDGPPQKIPIRYAGDADWPTEERRLTSVASDVAFTTDGKQIAFVAGGDVWVMDRELKEPRRVTDSPERESGVTFAPDGTALYFVSRVGGRPDIWRAERERPDDYWWRNDRFRLTRVSDDEELESRLAFRPDGKRLAFVKCGGELWTMDPDGGNTMRVLSGWDAPRYAWSPDGKWFVYSVQDNTFNSDVWVARADGSVPPFNISRHPDRDRSPAWSPDGRKIAFTGRRTHLEVDVYYVFLRTQDEEVSARDRKLKKAMAAMKGKKKARAKKKEAAKKETRGKANGTKSAPPAPKASTDKPEDPKKADPGKADAKEKAAKKNAKKDDGIEVKIDFEDLHRRVHRIRVPNSSESGLVWSADSKRLIFRAVVKSVSGLYAVEIPSDKPSPKKFSTTTVSRGRWLKKSNELVGLASGVPTAVSASGAAKKFSFRVRQRIDLAVRRTMAFDEAWRIMRESFYDGRFNNRDWDAIRVKYRPLARQCLGSAEFGTLVNMMLGELNASHLGFSGGRRGRAARAGNRWSPVTVHFGLRWDESHTGDGLRVGDVIPRGPAAQEKSRLRPGEIVLAVDGSPVNPATDLTELLNQGTDHDYRLKVRDADGKERRVTLRAVTTRTVRRLLYEKRLKDRQKMVDRLSGGTLGYCHIAGMNWSSFERFEAELYALGWGKDGLLIDVRDNGGGSTADHLLTVLCQPRHAITVPRRGGTGYPQDRRVYATWHKPIVVLCNQNSYSNAEIFTHAVKQLGRGRVVGVQTAGGVISTGGARVLDDGFIRTPFRAWFLLNGEDMELNGARPDFTVWPHPGELPAGVDRQLEKAVAVLLEDVQAWKAKPRPKPRYASERQPRPRRL